MPIDKLPSNPFNILKSFAYKMYLKINEIIDAQNAGSMTFWGEESTFDNLYRDAEINLPFSELYGELEIEVEQEIVTTFNALNLVKSYSDFGIFAEMVDTFNFPLLEEANTIELGTEVAAVYNLPLLRKVEKITYEGQTNPAITLPPLLVNGGLRLRNNPAIVTLDLNNLANTKVYDEENEIRCDLNENLVNLAIAGNLIATGSINFAGCGLNLASESIILTALDNGGGANGTLNLSGGTNAVLDAAALVIKANLVAKGWTVTNN